jgi:hypothetical protein
MQASHTSIVILRSNTKNQQYYEYIFAKTNRRESMNKYGMFLIYLLSLFLGTIAISQAEPSATVSVNPPSYQGKCPVTLMVDANITATSAGNMAIKYVFSTGYESPYATITFNAPGTDWYQNGFVAGAKSLPQYPTNGWVAIVLPGGKMSNKAPINVTCMNADLAVSDLVWTPPKNVVMKAPLPFGKLMVKLKNQGTGNSGPISLTFSCEGLPNTGPFGKTPSCPVGFFPKTLSADLAPGVETETGIDAGSSNPVWEGGKYKITAEAKLMSNSDEEPDITNNKTVLEINVPWATLTDISWMNATGQNYKGICSGQQSAMIVTGKISGNGYGTIKYQWIVDGNPAGNVIEVQYKVDDMIIEAGGVQVVPLQSKTGWAAIKVISPVQKESSHAPYTIECETFNQNLLKQSNLSFGYWKNLVKLSPAPQTCQECLSIFGQINGIDQQSMSLVKEGEALTKGLSTGNLNKQEDDRMTRRLNEISKQLDANMIKRKGLVDQYNKRVTDFNAQPKRLNPAVR